MITISKSDKIGFFQVDGLDYQQYHYFIEFDNTNEPEDIRNFTLIHKFTGEKIIQSRGYAEIQNDSLIAMTNWKELIALLNEVSALNNIDFSITDQNSDIIDYYICREIRALTLAIATIIDSYTINVTDASLVTASNYICMQYDGRAYQARILSKTGNVLTMDTPLDYNFPINTSISERSPQLNVDGSVTPVIAQLKPIPGVSWDITRIIIQMTHSSQPDDGKFGGIAALTRGIVLRKSNGIHHTIFNAKTNGDLRERMYDLSFSDAALPPSGQYGTSGRRSFNGMDKNGVTIRLNGNLNEALEVVIQDNLTTLNSFRIVAQGHIVVY